MAHRLLEKRFFEETGDARLRSTGFSFSSPLFSIHDEA